ncbi:Protein of unknown function DUF58 [Neorhodopirellula lusitana]|uniref:DUF58 domain-containing protein n=1 Tax=Neorhodopirellula lusitana TaxID=445327 RepID=A0ABY1PSY3_9BACT|nr:DUF58 domain-containing protein [Neorhodopirellula lusitana]SMP42561.1 Protein of unknown function DUF58 [Neorhodopirellula lusitana]
MSDGQSDDRVYVNLRGLSLLEHRIGGLSFLPRHPLQSLLSGRHASRIRGRGLNFEEIRNYQPGDDVRTIDWKVTARTRTPHARVFTEERDRPVLLLVDQRIGMFFGTQLYMKSVVAAQIAALSAWRVLDQGDRVGAIVFNDQKAEFIRPQRSRDCVSRVLRTLVDFNTALSASSTAKSNPAMLGNVFEQAARLASHDFLVIAISDFHGLDEGATRSLQRISQHNDLLAALVHDPSASALPSSERFVVSDGELQMELSGSKTTQRVEAITSGRIADVLALQQKLQSPVLPISTGEEVLPQLHRLLGVR